MNNEPAAWMMVNRENESAYLTFETPTRDMKISHEPHELYTRPSKQLSDEEIMKVVERAFGNFAYDNYFQSQWIDFARAIIKEITE